MRGTGRRQITARPGAAPATSVSAPAGFRFVHCNRGRVFALSSDGAVGAYLTDPGVIGISPIFRASVDVPGGFVDPVCGPGR